MKRRSIAFLALVAIITLAIGATAFAGGGNLVARYHLNEDATDSSAFGNDGVISGADFVRGRFGNALYFDGGDWVDVADDPSLDISTGSWEAWIRFDETPVAAGHLMNPLAKAEQYWVHASTWSGMENALQVKVNVGGTRYVASTAAGFIEADIWYHVVGTYDGDDLNLYVNGQLEATVTIPSGGSIQNTGNTLTIGSWSSHVDSFLGDIDEVRVWNCVLDAKTIAQHAKSNSSSSGKCA